MNRSPRLAAGLVAALVTLLAACSGQKEPAQQAVAKLDESLAAIHDGAAKYAPDTLQSVTSQVNSLKQSLQHGDYQTVVANSAAAKKAIKDLKDNVDAKQAADDAELAKTKQQWRSLSSEVPKMVTELHTQVDTLSKGGKLPKGVTKASLQAAKDGVASLDSMWNDANAAMSNADYPGAVAKAQAVKDKASELMHSLGMKAS
jgi:hypothetical protein